MNLSLFSFFASLIVILAQPVMAQTVTTDPRAIYREGIGSRGPEFTISAAKKPQIIVKDGMVDFLSSTLIVPTRAQLGEVWAQGTLIVGDYRNSNYAYFSNSANGMSLTFAKNPFTFYRIEHGFDGLELIAGTPWEVGRGMIIGNNGNVIIGYGRRPPTKLEVEGEIKLSTNGTPCAPETEGAIRYVKESKQFAGCDGTNWRLIQLGTIIADGSVSGGSSQ